jgi:hypothetical protein
LLSQIIRVDISVTDPLSNVFLLFATNSQYN